MALREAEAHPDLVDPAGPDLVGQRGVGNERPDHTDQVGGALRQDAFGDRGVDDASGDDDRHVYGLLDGGCGGSVEGRLGVPGAHVGQLLSCAESRVVAAADADVGDVRGQQVADLDQVRHREPAPFSVAVDADPNADRELVPHHAAAAAIISSANRTRFSALPPQRSERRFE